ncbi:tRNA dimethylallyltransferase [Oribacterium sp. KHPX15]|uniref:tRNA (adenosine(37)-N6)-dimethylallyltransferase MiaA n=1 Tax=Oribacterium sp. KHPX15 TaxID=1855342 RepID=UPI000898C08D|nr:tRNA (adenosine(37)-N6)-dimethylallyltransferase MiaA [Oribacterium sp. KHPX15]SDZ90713.1 tRNA dimethylallyltransferase [Oribacterium sp. KHPX15]
MKKIDLTKKPLIIIAGPTAVGKTSTSVALAKALDGEIVSADSVQVYRKLDIGSAKVTKDEMEGVPHHLIDIIDVTEDYDVSLFQKMASDAIEGIYERGHVPILAGGTGFYIQGLLYGIDFTEEDEDAHKEIRDRLEAMAKEPGGPEAMYKKLSEVDPKSLKKIHEHNIRRVIRALEFYELHGSPISAHNEEEREKQAVYSPAFFVLTDDREALYERINKRVDLMVEQGLIDEARWLYDLHLPKERTSMKGIGYRELIAAFEALDKGNLAASEKSAIIVQAVEKIKQDSRNYAKRQITWFKRERNVNFVNIQDFDYKKDRITEWITEKCLSLLG